MPELISLIERKDAFDARTAQYLRLGYDRFAAADFIIDTGGNLRGPALDIGTGRGLTAMALARQGLDVFSVDTDSDEQALAAFLTVDAGLTDRVQFICADASALSFPDKYFGCAVLAEVLHHLLNPQVVLAEAIRVLKPHGIIILADFSPEGFDIIARVHHAEGREHPVIGITPAEAATFLTEKGFVLENETTACLHNIFILRNLQI